MGPKSRIGEHFGPTNLRLRVHLPLEVPCGSTLETCGMVVANEERGWESGKAIVFDDSFIHSTWNWTDETRSVLLFDVWHPQLARDERAAIVEMFRKATGQTSTTQHDIHSINQNRTSSGAEDGSLAHKAGLE
jgi:aspartyl/asparaginyl beta-hydroxylase (cupin superfamily)